MVLGDESVHFGKHAVFWAKFDEASFLKTAYHKYLMREDFYRQVTSAAVRRLNGSLQCSRRDSIPLV